MKEEGCLATVSTDCPYTIQTLSPWLVDNVLVHLMPHLSTKSLGLIGKAGIGKTPVLETICCVMSRYWKRKLITTHIRENMANDHVSAGNDIPMESSLFQHHSHFLGKHWLFAISKDHHTRLSV